MRCAWRRWGARLPSARRQWQMSDRRPSGVSPCASSPGSLSPLAPSPALAARRRPRDRASIAPRRARRSKSCFAQTPRSATSTKRSRTLLQDLQTRDPAAAKTLLADERRWLAERDQSCPAEAQNAAACLTKAYQDRIAALKAQASAAAVRSAAISPKPIKRLWGRPSSAIPAMRRAPMFWIVSPPTRPAASPSPSRSSTASTDPAALRTFVLKAHPGLRFSPDVSKALDDLSDGTIALMALPGHVHLCRGPSTGDDAMHLCRAIRHQQIAS